MNTTKTCPLCGASMPAEKTRCRYCDSPFIDGGESVKTTGFSKSELAGRISAMRKRKWFFGTALALSLIAIVPAFAFLSGLGIVFLVLWFSFYNRWYFTRKALGRLIKASMVREILAEIFELESYEPPRCFSYSQIDESGLIGGYSWGKGSDLVRGKYKGVPVEFCDLTLNYGGQNHVQGTVDRNRP